VQYNKPRLNIGLQKLKRNNEMEHKLIKSFTECQKPI